MNLLARVMLRTSRGFFVDRESLIMTTRTRVVPDNGRVPFEREQGELTRRRSQTILVRTSNHRCGQKRVSFAPFPQVHAAIYGRLLSNLRRQDFGK